MRIGDLFGNLKHFLPRDALVRIAHAAIDKAVEEAKAEVANALADDNPGSVAFALDTKPGPK